MFRYFCIKFLHRRRRRDFIFILFCSFHLLQRWRYMLLHTFAYVINKKYCCYGCLFSFHSYIFIFCNVFFCFFLFLVKILTLINCKFIFMLLNTISYTNNSTACYLFIRFPNTNFHELGI